MENTNEDIGAQLKAQREKLGYSLQEAAQQTRIRKTFLESIENNQFSDLPGDAYVTGFVKSYARYLGVDNNALLAQLEETRQSAGPPPLKLIRVAKHQSRRFKKPSSGVGWSAFVLGFVAVLVLVLGGAVYLLSSMSHENDLAGAVSTPVVTDEGPVEKLVEAATEPVAEAIAAGDEEANTPLQEEAIVPAVELIVPKPKPLAFISPGGSSLRMLALSEGSLIIYLDERKSHMYSLHAGLDLTWDVKKAVKVELSGPGTARFWLSGQELDLGDMDSFQLQTDTGD